MFGGVGRHESAWAGERLRRFAERCARRDSDGDAELGWGALPDGRFVLPVREGSLVTYLVDARRGVWNLYMQWGEGLGDRFLAQGSRGAIERLARHVQRVGPPGGPEFRGQEVVWQQYDDETEHAVALGGGLRLMPSEEDDGDGVLLLAHNDPNGSISVLGAGEHDELQDGADELGKKTGARLRLSLGGRWRYLQAYGVDGIVGYLDLGDDLFVLGHLGGDEFGLACQSGGVQRALRTYSLDEVMRGDLGRVQDWADDEAPRRTSAARQPSRQRATSQRDRRRSRHAPHARVDLDGVDLIKALRHLTPEDDFTGEGAWTIPKILNGIRGLVQLALGDKILWAAGILRFIAEETGQQIHCCGKILNACLEWIAQRTKLLVPRGRKWELRLGELRQPNSALLRWMIRRGPLDVAVKRKSRATAVSQEPAGPEKMDSAPAAAPADAAPATTSTTSTTSTADTTSTAPTTSPSPTDDAAPSSPSAEPQSTQATPSATSPHPVVAPADESTSSPMARPDTGGAPCPCAPFQAFSCEALTAGTTTAETASGLAGTGSTPCAEPLPDAPPVRRQTRPIRQPEPELLASMSYEQLAKRWAADIENLQAQLATLPGLSPTMTIDGLAGSGESSGGVRRNSGKRKPRPP